jgi:hypothetical protein
MTEPNAWITVGVDAVMAPMAALPLMFSLAILALATAVLALLVARWTIDRRAIEATKRQMQAAIFEMRLFNDDLPAVLRAAFEVVRRNGTYLRLWLLPVLVLTVPLTPLMAQFEAFYAYAGLTPGASSLVTVDWVDRGTAVAALPPPAVSLEVPPEIEVETPAIWFPATHQTVWRISAKTTGRFELRVRADGDAVTKTLDVSEGVRRRSPVRVKAGFVSELLSPSERPLAEESPIAAISVRYPMKLIEILGWHVSWLVPFVGLTLLFALALKRPFGVVF